jgi:hypothetical protein
MRYNGKSSKTKKKEVLRARGFGKWCFRTDSGVGTDGARDLVDVGVGGLAQGGNGVDRGHALGQVGVGHELTELRGPQVGGDDLGRRNPVGIDGHHRGDGGQALGGLLSSDQHAGRVLQVGDGGTLGQELGVAQHLELVGGGGRQHALHGVGSAHGYGRLFHLHSQYKQNNKNKRKD